MVPLVALLFIMFLTWGAAVWASFQEPQSRPHTDDMTRDYLDQRKAA